MKTDTLVKHEGLDILYERLGPVDMERFIALMLREPFDYTKWHENLEDTLTVRELSKQAMKYQQMLT
jgi:hypothetical protein